MIALPHVFTCREFTLKSALFAIFVLLLQICGPNIDRSAQRFGFEPIRIDCAFCGPNGPGELSAKRFGVSAAVMTASRQIAPVPAPVTLPTGWGVVSDSTIRDSRTVAPTEPIRLADAFEKWRLPILIQEGRRESTIKEYRTALNAWGRFWNPEKHGENDEKPSVPATDGQTEPDIQNITRDTLAAFREWYGAGGRSKLQINKVLKNIRSILIGAEESERIVAAPKLKKLSAKKNASKIYLPYDHINAIYDSCSVATWPTHDRAKRLLSASPATFWRAAVVLWFNYGFRTQELIAYESGHESLKWSGVVFDAESPQSEIRNDHGWIWYVPQKQEHVKPDPLVLPMPATVRRHLSHLHQCRNESNQFVFPFPLNSKRFAATWKSIVADAGVKPKSAICGAESGYLIKHLRKTCATWHNFHNRGIAPFVLGHAERETAGASMTDTHYDNAEQSLVRAFRELPQPESFESNATEQLKLF